MSVSKDIQKEIEDYVRKKPRNIQEIANKIDKSWKTADKYVKELVEKEGNISIRKFREGSRGSLNVVYWSGRSAMFSSSFREHLFNKIENGGEFSPFDVYQCAEEDSREAFVETQEADNPEIKHDVKKMFKRAEEELLILSRNLSWAQLEQAGEKFTEVFRELAENGVDIKFLGRVDVSSRENAEKLLKINKEVGREAVTIKHSINPLRGFVVDNKLAELSEARELEEEYFNQKQEGKTTYVFYILRDKKWIKWLETCFWNLNTNALDARKRLEDLKTIENLSELNNNV